MVGSSMTCNSRSSSRVVARRRSSSSRSSTRILVVVGVWEVAGVVVGLGGGVVV